MGNRKSSKRGYSPSSRSNARVLVIGDLHAPFMHPDAVDFLDAVASKYNPDKVVQMGDEMDAHALSFHDSDPDLDSAARELDQARKALAPLYKMFPKVDVIESNHGSLIYRRAMKFGLPSEVLKGYREILHAPKGWNWHFDLVVPTASGPVYFHHGKTGTPGKLSKNMAMNAVQGHFHSNFYIQYWASPVGLYFDMNVGALADDKSKAMRYGSNAVPRPIVGCGVIIDGVPQLVPMVLKPGGRWIGQLGALAVRKKQRA